MQVSPFLKIRSTKQQTSGVESRIKNQKPLHQVPVDSYASWGVS